MPKVGSKAYAKAVERYALMSEEEGKLRAEGYQAIAGLDEAGRGPLAGPVCAAACILDPERLIIGLNDSKKLSPKQRLELYPEIIDKAVAYSICWRSAEEIDAINILEASRAAMQEALDQLQPPADFALLDAMHLKHTTIAQRALIQGDAKANCIAAASILAKVSRDRYMEQLDQDYPGYGFATHKGYGTAAHYAALEQLGPSPEHRLTFLKKLRLGRSDSSDSSRARGLHFEGEVAEHLRQQGFTILCRNYALLPYGEVDLIAKRGETAFIIEVKTRSKDPAGQAAYRAFDAQKQRRIRRLGQYYLDSHGHSYEQLRVLLAAVELGPADELLHIRYMEQQ